LKTQKQKKDWRVGLHFMIWDDKANDWQFQGRIIKQVGSDAFEVVTYSWMDGSEWDRTVKPASFFNHPKTAFFATDTAMRERWLRNRKDRKWIERVWKSMDS
jgi:hypothetical protein